MSIKIYTKTGDKGQTSLIGGTKVPKNNIRIETYGTVDELNAFIGLLSDHLSDPGIKTFIKKIQDRLFTIGSSLACDPEKEVKMKIPDLTEDDILLLEQKMDSMNAELPEMKHFILPGGHVAVSSAHVARCVCRRAERNCVHMAEKGMFVEELVIKYLNRLSDYLFVVSRYIAHLLQVKEITWEPRIS